MGDAEGGTGHEATPPLAGLMVVDACSFLAGPFAALMLSDLGATVVKVEPPPRGDPYRGFAPHVNGVGLPAAAVNRGKQSRLVDLKTRAGLSEMEELLRSADVFLESWRPGVAERFGLSRSRLAEINSTLVHVSITGYGEDGPLAGRGAFDGIIQAESGIAGLDPNASVPRPIPTYLADKATSMMVAQAALAGLVRRSSTGLGASASIAMLDALAYFNFPDLLAAFSPLSVPPTEPPRASTTTVLRGRDGYVSLAPATGKQIKSVCELVDHPEWVTDLRGLGTGWEFRREFMRRVESAIADRPVAAFVADLVARDVPAAVVLDAAAHFAHPQVVHNVTYQVAEDPDLGTFRFPRHPARFAGVSRVHRSVLPRPGHEIKLDI